MKKIVVFLSKKPVVARSWVGKYLFDYFNTLDKEYEVEYVYQPDETTIYWRFFILPKIIERDYKWYVKVFLDELFLTAINSKNCEDTVVIVQHYPYLSPVGNFEDFLIKVLTYFYFKRLKYVTHIVSGSEFTKGILTDYLKVPAKKITTISSAFDPVVYSPVTVDERAAIRAELASKFSIPALTSDKKCILYVGTTDSRKNLITLSKALGGIENSYFIHVGKNTSPRAYVKITKNLEDGKVESYRASGIDEADLIKFYRAADVFVFPSLYEGFGRPPVEAQLCGCPVITTHCGSLKTVITESALILRDPKNSDELHELIKTALFNTQVRDEFIQKGLENGRGYSLEKWTNSWREILSRLTGK